MTVTGDGVTVSSPTFSPDGSKIAFTQCVGDCGDPMLQGTGSIWVMNPDGSGVRQILNQATAGVQPDGTLDWGVGAAPPRCLGRRATIVAQAGGGPTRGTPGNDVIVGSPGNDDLGLADSARDRVSCGAGDDRARHDTADRLNRCERVRRS